MMSLTDQAFVTPGSKISDSERPAYESLKAIQAWLSRPQLLLTVHVVRFLP